MIELLPAVFAVLSGEADITPLTFGAPGAAALKLEANNMAEKQSNAIATEIWRAEAREESCSRLFMDEMVSFMSPSRLTLLQRRARVR
jgi:hypothetical protein